MNFTDGEVNLCRRFNAHSLSEAKIFLCPKLKIELNTGDSTKLDKFHIGHTERHAYGHTG